MAIVCKKCKYQISEQEINEYYKGFFLDLLKSSIELVNNLLSLFLLFKKIPITKKNEEIFNDPETELENTLLGRANYYKMPCSQCSKYKGWITIKNTDKESDEAIE